MPTTLNEQSLPLIDDDRTDAERAYFESGGSNADGLAPEPAAPPSPTEASPAEKPAVQPDGADEGEEIVQGTHRRRMVNYGALHEERERRKALDQRLQERDRQLAELQEKFARGDERLRLLSEALTPQQQAEERQAEREDPEPDPEKDIFGWVGWTRRRNARLEQALVETQQHLVNTTQQYQGDRAEQHMVSTYQQDAANFARQNPDFRAAYAFIIGDRDRELQAMGYENPNERKAMIYAEERDLVLRHLQNGKSPAAAVYALAKGRGYRAPEAAPTSTAPAPAPAAAAAPQLAPSAQPSVTEEIARLAQAQSTSRSLSGAGGPSPGMPTVEMLANLSDDEFAALTAKHGGLENLLKRASG